MHMAWSFVVHKYFQRQTKWLLTSFGRLTIIDARIPRHAAMFWPGARSQPHHLTNILPALCQGIIFLSDSTLFLPLASHQ